MEATWRALVVSTLALHAGGSGSIPCKVEVFFEFVLGDFCEVHLQLSTPF